MENNQNKSVIVLLLPLLTVFSNLVFENDEYEFLSLNQIVKNYSFFSSESDKIDDKKNFLSHDLIFNHDFSSSLVKKIQEVSQSSEKQVVLVNYPTSISQFKKLFFSLKEKRIEISKVILSSVGEFEILEKVSLKFFVCPFCLNFFEKTSCVSEDKYLICPSDGKKTSFSSSKAFNKKINENYFKSILEIAQNIFSLSENVEKKTRESENLGFKVITILLNQKKNQDDYLEFFLDKKMKEMFSESEKI